MFQLAKQTTKSANHLWCANLTICISRITGAVKAMHVASTETSSMWANAVLWSTTPPKSTLFRTSKDVQKCLKSVIHIISLRVQQAMKIKLFDLFLVNKSCFMWHNHQEWTAASWRLFVSTTSHGFEMVPTIKRMGTVLFLGIPHSIEYPTFQLSVLLL